MTMHSEAVLDCGRISVLARRLRLISGLGFLGAMEDSKQGCKRIVAVFGDGPDMCVYCALKSEGMWRGGGL